MSKAGGVAGGRGKRKRARGSGESRGGSGGGAGGGAPANPVRGAKYHCNYCGRDISGLVRIKCAVCTDFDLCLECFSVGVEVFPHKNTHGYRVVDDLSFPLFATNWGADEELLLLEGVDMYGLGNWASVAEHVGTKGKEECEGHYYRVYLKAGGAPTPTSTPVHGARAGMTPQKTPSQVSGGGASQHQAPPAKRFKMEEEEEEKGEEEVDGGRGEEEGVGEREEVVRVEQGGGKGGGGGGVEEHDEMLGGNTYEVTGYNAKREEFDPEYDNEAESCIADIEFNVNDPEGIRERKLKLLEIYNHRLDQRDVRREFIRERKLLNVKKQQGLEKKRSAELNDLHAVMRVFARYLSQDEHEALVEGLYIEKKLREHIDNLKEMRRRGYRTFADVEQGERENKFRKASRQGGGVSKPKLMGLQGKTSSPALREWRQKRGIDLDITLLPGWELLSSKECDLCSSCRFVPAHYLALKDRLLREEDKLGFFSRQDVKGFFRLETSKAHKVYDIMSTLGWIRSAPAEKTAVKGPIPETPAPAEDPSKNVNQVSTPL